ncbi:MAG: hypothetical protein RIM99_13110 [Cyclobacteriaceae bacterium]
MINDRINRLITVLEMNPTSFSDSVGVNVTVIFNIIKGRRSKPSYELILKILHQYDKLNSEWLIKGDGAMWNDDIVKSHEIAPAQVNLENRVKELFVKLRLLQPDAYEVHELEELVSFVLEESDAQKNKLILLNDRQEGMLNVLREKLKLKV